MFKAKVSSLPSKNPVRAQASRFRILSRQLLLGASALTALRLGHQLWNLRMRPARRLALRGKVAVITGASSGIGRALACELAAAGCHLVLAARRDELLSTLATELESRHGVRTLVVRTDVADQAQAEVLAERALEHFGHVDILINNAGIATYSAFDQDPIAGMRQVMEVNYWGTVYCTRAMLPAMQARHRGMIVNISSVAGKMGQPGIANYSASKHAVNGLSAALRIELARFGIHVLLICPTSTKTDIVSVSSNHSAIRFNPEQYFGMSTERVARETVSAILDRRREHVLGAGERLGLVINTLSPSLVDAVIKRVIPFIFKT
ncbi:MAG: short chain dehydrogenase [Candidatus Melainabacteria bacterium HGW-Melainabacteria-1]|nr:MAG: short chain dehydrogenase [Candidatus Melainabacteria bacterium HGW-Melainabacteria-1]